VTTKRITMSIREAAEATGLSCMTITRLIKSGKLKAIKLDRRVLIRLCDLEKMLAENPAA
jgi:excisionase family DNA binding protein